MYNADIMLKVWNSVLEDCCNCYADPVTGNRPCDSGYICDGRCQCKWVHDEFENRLMEEKEVI